MFGLAAWASRHVLQPTRDPDRAVLRALDAFPPLDLRALMADNQPVWRRELARAELARRAQRPQK